jgi:hypothetical protein
VLGESIDALSQAAERLAATHRAVTTLFPITPATLQAQSQIAQERLDAYAIRYARCQDLLFPAMRALARAQLEPKADGGFLQLHALMRKQGVAASLDDWERQRSLRNAVGHDYPDAESIVDILNGIHAATPEILDAVTRLRTAASRLAESGD